MLVGALDVSWQLRMSDRCGRCVFVIAYTLCAAMPCYFHCLLLFYSSIVKPGCCCGTKRMVGPKTWDSCFFTEPRYCMYRPPDP